MLAPGDLGWQHAAGSSYHTGRMITMFAWCSTLIVSAVHRDAESVPGASTASGDCQLLSVAAAAVVFQRQLELRKCRRNQCCSVLWTVRGDFARTLVVYCSARYRVTHNAQPAVLKSSTMHDLRCMSSLNVAVKSRHLHHCHNRNPVLDTHHTAAVLQAPSSKTNSCS